MKRLLKRFNNGIKLLFETIVSIIDVFCFGHPFARQRKLEKKCINAAVLANGPSARSIILQKPELLTDCDLIAMNDAAVSDDFERLKPRYYILLDPAYFGGSWLGDKELTENHYDEVLDKLYAKLYKVDWEMTLYLPFHKKAKSVAERFQDHKFVKIGHFNGGRVQGFNSYNMWALKHGLGLPSSRNIIIPAILLMINADYKNVYLYGAEFSWTKYMDIDVKTGLMFMNDRHFYSADEIRFFDRGAYRLRLEHIAEMLRGLEMVAQYAKRKGVTVINRTQGSFIDAFDYENPDTLPRG